MNADHDRGPGIKAITGTPGGTRVKVPAALLADRSLGATWIGAESYHG